MGSNYNVHVPNDDNYYYCPNNECPCNVSFTHRDDYWRTHAYGYDSLADYENAHADFKRVFPDYD